MKNQLLIKASLTIFIITSLLAAIVLARDFLIPLAVSIFLSYLIYPLVWKIESHGVHRAIAILLVLLMTLILVGAIGLFLSVKLSNMDINLPDIKSQMNIKTDAVLHLLESRLGLQSDTLDHYFSQASENLFSSWESKFGSLFTATTTTLFQIGILPVYTFFLLFYRTKTAHFIFRLVGRKNKPKALKILREISTITTKYMAGLLIVVFILSILNSTGLLIIGVPHPLLFGILAAFLNLIPYFGTFIGGLIPVLFVLFTFPYPFPTILQIIILFVIVQFLENNLLTPNIVGNNIKINPLAIILSLLLGNMIWGIPGMLIIVPTLAILKIIMQNIEEFQPFAFLISDSGTSEHRVNFIRFFQFKKKK
ncbi:MAG TPA: AI-2E family transporter [Sunxiuqinia sp.]|nr:AI-2E family transporter [Sunxiuqinia sp.]